MDSSKTSSKTPSSKSKTPSKTPSPKTPSRKTPSRKSRKTPSRKTPSPKKIPLETLYFPKPKGKTFLYDFMKKYIMVEETLEIHNIIIEYIHSGKLLLESKHIYDHACVFYDNNYLSKAQKNALNKRVELLSEDKQPEILLFSYIYVLSNDCARAFEHLDKDEQLGAWMNIKSQLPCLTRSVLNTCNVLIKSKLEEINQAPYKMSSQDETSIFLRPLPGYRHGSQTNKMHICFNGELLHHPALYFEAIHIFHSFYLEHMANLCYYKVIGGVNDRDSTIGAVVAYNLYNRKMADIAIYLEHITSESQIIEYGERFRTYFMEKWKHKIIPFSKSKLLFNSSTNASAQGKYFIQYTSGASGDTKLSCMSEIMKSETCATPGGGLTSPDNICRFQRYKVKPGIKIKKAGEHYRVDCDNSPNAASKECKKGIGTKKLGRLVNTKCVKNRLGESKDICYDELCFF